MKMIKIEEDVHVRDEYNVRRRAFIAGTEVEETKYNAVMKTNTLVTKKPVDSKVEEPVIENKMLSEEETVDLVSKAVESVKVKPVKKQKATKSKAKAKGK